MNKKTEETLYVVCVIFNPRGFKSRKKLYENFAPYIRYSGAELITVEVAFAGRPFEITSPDDPNHLQLRSNSEMWHKERALNLGIQHLVKLYPDAKKVAWIDADVQFTNPNWVQDTLTALDHYHVIQLYSEAQSLNSNNESQWKTPGLFYNYINKVGYSQHPPLPLKYTKGGHPGLAWAATLESLNHLGGLLDICVHGSGDTHMANALMGDIHLYDSKHTHNKFDEALEKWAGKCDKYIKKNIGYIPGICYHYWHGKPQKRGYEKRFDLICFHKYDPTTDIQLELNGLYRWSGDKKGLEHDLRLSMISRNEDEMTE